MNNALLFEHPKMGSITTNDLIYDLNLIIHDLTEFENIILNILKELSDLSDEDISSLFNLIPLERLNWILYVLKTYNEKE